MQLWQCEYIDNAQPFTPILILKTAQDAITAAGGKIIMIDDEDWQFTFEADNELIDQYKAPYKGHITIVKLKIEHDKEGFDPMAKVPQTMDN